MRRNTSALSLVLTILVLASAVILMVNFQLRERSSRPMGEGKTSPGEVAAPFQAIPQVDGRISEGEYVYRYRDPKIAMELYWTIDEREGLIYLGLRGPTPGWVAISLAPTGLRMKGGDILIGYVKDGQVHLRDDYADQLTSHASDEELGGTNDILEGAGSSGPQGTTIELVRHLATNDAYDKPIEAGMMRIQLAYSEFTNFIGFHDENWSRIEVDFHTGRIEPLSP
jgi:hypothetical protein